MSSTRYGMFGRYSFEGRTIKISRPVSSGSKTVSSKDAKIFCKITQATIQLFRRMRAPDIMREWRDQISIAFRNANKRAGRSPIDLPCQYLLLARVHDRWGGLPKIITKALDAKWPEGLKITCRATDCEIYLENVKADLYQKGLLSHKQRSKITKAEANMKARDILKKDPEITGRELAQKIGCSNGLISELPAWRAVQEQRKKGRKPKKRRLTNRMLKVAGTGKKDQVLKELILEQQADEKEDDRQAKLYIDPKKGKLQIHD